jgi:pimeloyl-ACP methyl ester carboxylesterase
MGVRVADMLRYRIEGSGFPLLLIHGWGVTYSIWKNLMPLLMAHFQLIMIELPGVGGSSEVDPAEPYYQGCAEAIEELRQRLGIEQWAILAYSCGTRAAEAYMQRYPQHVHRAVFLCPVYLTALCSLGLRCGGWLERTRPRVVNWLLSDWRLYGLVLAVGFNGRRYDYTHEWVDEIEVQPLGTLKRMLYELPGKGRSPFTLSSVPTLFVWGRRDALTARPHRPRAHDVFIPANHSAPLLAASSIAEVIIPFLECSNLNMYRSAHIRQQNTIVQPIHNVDST